MELYLNKEKKKELVLFFFIFELDLQFRFLVYVVRIIDQIYYDKLIFDFKLIIVKYFIKKQSLSICQKNV